ncbi:efflux RND transporter periplasmic adaptor subunit [Aestuariivirga sp.]|jgi:membrane fusion protein (multidrug efflux system)|uniref:efflux RND transporter periplasmic adaptor subunit n=1 Tax=Aestuariivirga sp. TaxID=2650926 RepID=UPI0037851CBA
MMTFWVRGFGLVVALLIAPLLSGCDEAPKQPAAAQAPPVAVTVVRAEIRDLRPSVSFSGRVTALQKVDLLARIEGFLDTQNFAEGAQVKAGDLLYVIEKAPYEAKVASAEGAVATGQARYDRAEIELKRQTTLVARDAAAQTKLDDARAARDEARGSLDKLEAELTQAKLQLSYTEIKAPISGRIGKSLLTAGSFVSPASGTLATIVAQDPIGVTFPVSQRDILAVREQAASGASIADLTVYLQLGKDKRYDQAGKVDFVDVQVNTGTDAVDVRASFPNPDGVLVDGQLVTAVVESSTAKPVLVVPVGAIQINQSGTFVLIVNADNKIEVRPVEAASQAGNGVAVAKGLAEGDRVVIEGVQKVRPGQTVEATEIKPEA